MARSSIVSEFGFIVSFVWVRAIYCFLNQSCEPFLDLTLAFWSKFEIPSILCMVKIMFGDVLEFTQTLQTNTVKPLLSRHLRDLPLCPLNRGCKNCAINIQRLPCTVIKLHVVKEAIQSISRVQVHYLSLPTLICL